MAKRPCARVGCRNLVKRGYCAFCSKYSLSSRTERERPSAHKRGYTRRWDTYSTERRKRYPTCEGLRLERNGPVVINTHPGIVRLATLTDHIEAHKGDMVKFWDEDNHQSSCDDCHNVKTAREDGGFGTSRASH